MSWKTLKGFCWCDSERGYWLVITFVTAISILANKSWMKCSKSGVKWRSGDLVWSTCMCSMYVCATLLSSAVDNLILIVLCSCQLRETVYCHRPLPWHMPSSLPLPLCLIVSSLLDAVTPTWHPDRPHPPASWIINILPVCCQYPPHIKWTRTNIHVTTAYSHCVNQRQLIATCDARH